MKIRRANCGDARAIFELGRGSDAFRMNERVPFYEFNELKAWLGAPEDNILLVAEAESKVAGFLFCKIMSVHWALLDNFYVIPEARGSALGAALLKELRAILRARGIQYLSSLIEESDARSQAYAARVGFKPRRRYQWIDTFLDDKDFLPENGPVRA